MSTPINTTNANTTLQSIKVYIREERGKLSPEMQRALVDLATVAYEIKGVANPRIAGASFIRGNIFTAKNY